MILQQVKAALKNLRENRIEVIRRHDNAMFDLGQELKDIQKQCPHLWEYHPDASGNNDSWNECTVCGFMD